MGTTSGTLSDEGPEPLGVSAEVKPFHSTFSELQKLRHSSAICFHYLFFKRVCLGSLPYPPSMDPCSRLACLGTVGLATDLSLMLFFAQYRGQAHGGIRGDFRRSHPSLPVSSSGHSVGSFSLLINGVASWQPCLRGTSWSREAGSRSCGGNHQRASPEASQG